MVVLFYSIFFRIRCEVNKYMRDEGNQITLDISGAKPRLVLTWGYEITTGEKSQDTVVLCKFEREREREREGEREREREHCINRLEV